MLGDRFRGGRRAGHVRGAASGRRSRSARTRSSTNSLRARLRCAAIGGGSGAGSSSLLAHLVGTSYFPNDRRRHPLCRGDRRRTLRGRAPVPPAATTRAPCDASAPSCSATSPSARRQSRDATRTRWNEVVESMRDAPPLPGTHRPALRPRRTQSHAALRRAGDSVDQAGGLLAEIFGAHSKLVIPAACFVTPAKAGAQPERASASVTPAPDNGIRGQAPAGAQPRRERVRVIPVETGIQPAY